MRLIDADKLYPDCMTKNGTLAISQSQIANAPTVERPQGEWIDHSEDYGYVECPVCGNLTTCHDNKDELHYCWYCGSRMGNGAAE